MVKFDGGTEEVIPGVWSRTARGAGSVRDLIASGARASRGARVATVPCAVLISSDLAPR